MTSNQGRRMLVSLLSYSFTAYCYFVFIYFKHIYMTWRHFYDWSSGIGQFVGRWEECPLNHAEPPFNTNAVKFYIPLVALSKEYMSGVFLFNLVWGEGVLSLFWFDWRGSNLIQDTCYLGGLLTSNFRDILCVCLCVLEGKKTQKQQQKKSLPQPLSTCLLVYYPDHPEMLKH